MCVLWLAPRSVVSTRGPAVLAVVAAAVTVGCVRVVETGFSSDDEDEDVDDTTLCFFFFFLTSWSGLEENVFVAAERERRSCIGGRSVDGDGGAESGLTHKLWPGRGGGGGRPEFRVFTSSSLLLPWLAAARRVCGVPARSNPWQTVCVCVRRPRQRYPVFNLTTMSSSSFLSPSSPCLWQRRCRLLRLSLQSPARTT